MREEDYKELFPHVEQLPGSPSVTFLLGTDSHIEEGTEKQERRVGIIPSQAGALKSFLEHAGLSPALFMVAGAGAAAGFTDEDYELVGFKIVTEEALTTLPAPVNVFHALKEPCAYESSIPGPFARIGALHTGDPESNSGFFSLMESRNCAAVFDGSYVGGYSYKSRKGFPIPIRSSMSVFAGEIAADIVTDRLREAGVPSKVVISGGGVAGRSAAHKVLGAGSGDGSNEILILEREEGACESLIAEFRSSPNVSIIRAESVATHHLNAASGLILTAFTPGKQAPKVVEVAQFSALMDGGVIVDVAIDEGGSIAEPSGSSAGEAILQLNKNLKYVADKNMPRKYPAKASESHGKAVLPYLGTLLYLCGRYGGAYEAGEYLLNSARSGCEERESYLDLLVCDLRNGLAFLARDRSIRVFEDAVKQPDRMLDILRGHGYSATVECKDTWTPGS